MSRRMRLALKVAVVALVAAAATSFVSASSDTSHAAAAEDGPTTVTASSLLAARHSALLSRVSSFGRTRPEVSSHSTMAAGDAADALRHGLYPSTMRFKIEALGKEFVIQLEKNERIVAHDYQYTRLDYGGGAQETGTAELVSSESHQSYEPTRHCYYHGHVVGDPRSWVALDTCHGLSGVIHAHEETFAITPEMIDGAETVQEGTEGSSRQPMRSQALRHMHAMSQSPEEQHEKLTHEHVVYRLQDYTPLKSVCGVTEADEQAHATQDPQALFASPADEMDANEAGIKAVPLVPGSTPSNRRFVELLVVNDYDRFKQHGENTEHDTLSLVNLIDSYYRVTSFDYSYRIVLVGQITFTNGDPYQIPYVNGRRPNVPSNPRPTPSPRPTPIPTPTPPSDKPTPVPTPTPKPTPTPTWPTGPGYPDFSKFPPELQYLIPEIIANMEKQKKNQPTTPTTPTTPSTPYNPYNPYAGEGKQQQPAEPVMARPTTPAVETQGFNGLLEVFNSWHSNKRDLPHRDNTQLFSGLNFASGVLGLANVGMCCTPAYSGSVCAINEPSAAQNAIIAAHETGHTLGMSHDSMGNSCPSTGYIMASVAGVGTQFSTCSVSYTDKWMTARPAPQCIMDVPRVWLSQDSEIATSTDNQTAIVAPTQAQQKQHLPEAAIVQEKTVVPSELALGLVGGSCFLGGLLVACGLMYLVQHLRTPRVADVHALKSSVHQQAFALHIVPSAPSTPIAATKSLSKHNFGTDTTVIVDDDDSSMVLSSHQLQHMTQATRRASLSGAQNGTAVRELNRALDTIPSESPEC